MEEYCENAESEDATASTNLVTATWGLSYILLAAQYRLPDDMEISGTGSHQATIKQEFQSYITAPLSLKSMDILKFWEVSCGQC
jgi:hypothetical protein